MGFTVGVSKHYFIDSSFKDPHFFSHFHVSEISILLTVNDGCWPSDSFVMWLLSLVCTWKPPNKMKKVPSSKEYRWVLVAWKEIPEPTVKHSVYKCCPIQESHRVQNQQHRQNAELQRDS